MRAVLLFLLGVLVMHSSVSGQEKRSIQATIYKDTGTKTDSGGFKTHTFDVLHGSIDEDGIFRVRATGIGYEVDAGTADERAHVKAATYQDACVVLSKSLPEIGQKVRKELKMGKDWYAVVPVKGFAR